MNHRAATTAFVARPRVTVVPVHQCRPPLELYQVLAGRPGVEGAVLMESAAKGETAGRRSLVVPEGVIRLQVRGERATFHALGARARPLLDALSSNGERKSDDWLEQPFRAVPPDPALTDEARIASASVLDAVRLLANLVADEVPASPAPGCYGAFSYELVDLWETLPSRPFDPWREPDIDVVLALDTIVYDHLAGEVRIVTRALGPGDEASRDERHREYEGALRGTGPREPATSGRVGEKEAVADVSDEDFLQSVRKFLCCIERGDLFQGVLSRGLSMQSAASPLAVYRELRRENPSPYMFYVDLGDGALFGASPETCVKVEGGILEIRPIAGTAPRGFGLDGAIDPELDSRLAVGLLLDSKEQAEHAMLLDLARNDVARVSLPGTRRVESPFTIEKYSHVQHLVSRVVGRLAPGLDALHAYRAAANMGTLTGAPKLRAMELIRETEPFARGFYGGAVGYFLQDGTFDSCIVIRSLRWKAPGCFHTRAGAGIVADSIPERELAETYHKARATRRAVALAESVS